ncbi:MAG: hypothetical protein RIT45_3727 [Pseudomonadota bacterium]
MNAPRLAAWAGYEAALVATLPAGRQRALAWVGLCTPLGALVVGFGARQWLLDAGAGTPAALGFGVFAGALTALSTRLLVAGGGMPARALAQNLADAAAPNAPVDVRTGAVSVPLRYHPAWLAPLWCVATAVIWTLPLAAHTVVALHVEPGGGMGPAGALGWLQAAWQARSATIGWALAWSALGAAPAIAALAFRGSRREHAMARARRDHAWMLREYAAHRATLEQVLGGLGFPGFEGLGEEAYLDPPFALRERPAPWREAQPAEVGHVRWLLERGGGASS